MVSRCVSSSKKYVSALLVLQLYLAVNGEIIVSPKDTEASIGETIELVCTSTVDAIEWHHLRAGTVHPEIVYKDGYIFDGYRGRFDAKQCSSAGDVCRLVIQNVSLNDAGTYSCIENSEEYVREAAQLIVYEQYPSTHSCVTRITCSPECNSLELSCNMKYTGNVDAVMEWWDSAGEFVSSTNITINGITTSTVQLNRDHSQSPSYTCRIKYPTTTFVSRYKWTAKPQDFLASSNGQHENNRQMTAFITIFVVLTAVLFFGMMLSLVVLYITIHRLNKRKRKRRTSGEGVENDPIRSIDMMQQLTEPRLPLINNEPEHHGLKERLHQERNPTKIRPSMDCPS